MLKLSAFYLLLVCLLAIGYGDAGRLLKYLKSLRQKLTLRQKKNKLSFMKNPLSLKDCLRVLLIVSLTVGTGCSSKRQIITKPRASLYLEACQALRDEFQKTLQKSPEDFDKNLIKHHTPREVARLVNCLNLLDVLIE